MKSIWVGDQLEVKSHLEKTTDAKSDVIAMIDVKSEVMDGDVNTSERNTYQVRANCLNANGINPT
jgi:hypothetical protein